MMRTIRKNSSRSAEEVLELLAAVFALETLRPSRCLWIVSPWITDLEILDNRFGAYPALDVIGRRRVTLAEVLVASACRSGEIVVATRDDPINEPFLSRIGKLMREHKVVDQFTVRREPTIERMHQKALTGDDFVISGSMNFTFSGVMLNKEHVQFQTDQVSVAAAQMDLQKQFGGRLK